MWVLFRRTLTTYSMRMFRYRYNLSYKTPVFWTVFNIILYWHSLQEVLDYPKIKTANKPMKAEMANKEDDRWYSFNYHFVCLFFIFFLMFVNDTMHLWSLYNVWMFSRTSTPGGRKSSVRIFIQIGGKSWKKRLLLYPYNLFHFTFSRGGFFSFLLTCVFFFWFDLEEPPPKVELKKVCFFVLPMWSYFS